jgi:hypothetical protein
MKQTAMVRRTPLRATKPMKRSRERREKGLGHRVAAILGFLRPIEKKEPTVLRSEQHRRNVAELGCLITGKPAQACHVNFGKGMGLKACDSLCFPLAPELHAEHDQGGIDRADRWKREWEYVDQTRARLIAKGQWSAEVERHYQRAIEPLKRVVHPDHSDKEKAA